MKEQCLKIAAFLIVWLIRSLLASMVLFLLGSVAFKAYKEWPAFLLAIGISAVALAATTICTLAYIWAIEKIGG